MKRWILGIAALLTAAALAGCGNRTIRVDLVPVSDHIQGQLVERDPGLLVTSKIAIVDVSGMLGDGKSKGLLSAGHNPVSDFRETLQALAADDSVKAVIVRFNTPGGTVTASDMMFRDLEKFKATTHKPVVGMMMSLCASGGFYVSCATDYRIAYPTTVTGSIGVIVEAPNFAGTLDKIGVKVNTIASGPNKDAGSPFRPMTERDRQMFEYFVKQDYARFVRIVKESHPRVDPQNWPMLTDGRVLTGADAARYGLVDQVGDIDTAIAKAKQMANIKKAKVLVYSYASGVNSVYAAKTSVGEPSAQFNAVNLNLDPDAMASLLHPQFLYMWMGGN